MSKVENTDRDISESQEFEASSLHDIVTWSKDRPMWQRDALCRLRNKKELEESDYVILLAIAKGDNSKVNPLDYGHVRSLKENSSTINLRSIENSENVNALVPGEKLTFEKGNCITVIYGDNGSGKSGYARILKSACRARTKNGDNIRPNIYDKNPGIPKATINFSVNTQNEVALWEQSQITDPRLSGVSVFDSDTANLHVDGENKVAYMPFPLELLRRLSKVCEDIKDRIKNEEDTLSKLTPDSILNPKCKEITEVGKLIQNLDSKTSKESIEKLSTVSEEEKSELDTLRVDLASDPTVLSRNLLSSMEILKKINLELEELHKVSSNENIVDIQSKHSDYEAKRVAAIAAANSLFKSSENAEFLPNLGAESWRALWESARTYSEQDAYPDKPFPFPEEGAKCVLCQQDLSQEAINRLKSFESFVKDETKRKEDRSRLEYEMVKEKLSDAIIKISKIKDNFKFIRDQIGDEELAKKYKRSVIQTKWRVRCFLASQSTHINKLPISGEMPNFQSKLNELQKRNESLLAEKDSSERLVMTNRLNELKDRLWLGIVKNDLLGEIDRLIEKEKLKQIIEETSTNAITRKSSELAEHLITDALTNKFSEEVKKIEMENLVVALQHTKSSAGSPLFKVQFTRNPKEKNISTILNEGEFRCIALVAFLAEQATVECKSTIVFDDPVSSLDHIYREKVADRLALEGNCRQVIIFSHDLAFLHLLQSACKKCKTRLTFRCVEKVGEKIGLCKSEAPLRVQSVGNALDSLERDLNNKKINYENGNTIEWRVTIDYFQKELRDLWERSVEQSLSPVMMRLQNKVKVGGLKQVSVIEEEDFKIAVEGYGRCSELLHSESANLNKPLPKPDKIKKEISIIREWITSIEIRQN